jgi:ABC-type nitrate/sulfonate/bicarbonate transport system substrate-binding protein
MITERGRTWRTALVTLAALAAAVAIGCGDDDEGGGGASNASGPPDKPVKIRMGWGIPAEEIKYVMMKHPKVARHLGTWYDVEWRQFSGTALGVQGLAAGTLDCATVGGLSVANGLDKGADIVILGEFLEERKPNFSTAWMVRKDSGIDSLDDLRGKTVATNAVGGSTDYLQDFYIEEQAGLKAGKDYKKVEVPFGQMQEALLAKRIDMGLFPQPFYGAINATGDVKAMFRLTDEIEPFVQLLNGCRRDFVEKHEAVIEKFQEDWATIAQWIADPKNRDATIQASAAATKIPAKVLDKFLLTRQDYFRPGNGAVNVGALQKEWDFFRERGGIQQDLKVTDYIIEDLFSLAAGGNG